MRKGSPFPYKIVSGGQSGAERAALDFALSKRLAFGGFCPLGRRAEDGRISASYGLRETDAVDYSASAWQNVKEADATVIFDPNPLRGGDNQIALVTASCKKAGKPYAVLTHSDALTVDVTQFQAFLRLYQPGVLYVTGLRESFFAGLYQHTKAVLDLVYQHATLLENPTTAAVAARKNVHSMYPWSTPPFPSGPEQKNRVA
jgi:hypothetical protein